MLAEASEQISPALTAIGQAVVGVVVVAGYVANHIKGNGREKAKKAEVDGLKDTLRETIATHVQAMGTDVAEKVDKRITRFEDRVDQQLVQLREGLTTLDGRMTTIDGRVDEFDKRDRDRLERELERGRNDRRAAS